MRELLIGERAFVSGGYGAAHIDGGGGNTAPTYQPPGGGYGPNGDMTYPHYFGWCLANGVECAGWNAGEHGPTVADWISDGARVLAGAISDMFSIPQDEGTGGVNGYDFDDGGR